MKKIIALLLILSMAICVLAACDDKKDETNDNKTPEVEAPADPDPVVPDDPTPPDDNNEEEEKDLDGVDDEYMPDDGWTDF
ncbi:MAG: hypothetical protein IJW03_03575 [Clostridia bacterium]|nr:hypothetical protein [Clostridia bacterium]